MITAKTADDILATGEHPQLPYDLTDLDVLHNQLLADRFEMDFARIFDKEDKQDAN